MTRLAGPLAFVLTAAVVHALLPPPPSPAALKLDHFARSRYQAVFLGASVVYRHIDPAQFDAELARAGILGRSFNFGLPAMQAGEALQLTRAILTREGLRYLFVDTTLIGLENPYADTARFAAWHDLPTTLDSVRSLVAARGMPSARLADGWNDVRGLLRNTARVGAFGAWLDEPFEAPAGRDGFLPLEDELDEHERRVHEQYLATGPGPLVIAQAGDDDTDVQYQNGILSRLAGECRAHGVALILLRAPSLLDRYPVHVDAPLFDFQDPVRHAELYDRALRFNKNHLNRRGAALYTHLVAERTIEWLRAVR